MKTIYILSGVARSGKSTYAKSLQGIIVSRDTIREHLFGDKSCINHEELVSAEFDKQFNKALLGNENIIIDNTNLKIKYVNHFIESAKKYKFNVEIIRFFVPLKTLYKRAKESNFSIFVINKMLKTNQMWKFEITFPKIKITDIINEYVDISEYYELMDFDQENPNHSHTLLVHSLLSEEYMSKECILNKELSKDIGKIHDLGKVLAKEYDETKKIYRYTGHDIASWYLSRTVKNIPKFKSYLALLHMHHFNIDNGMSKQKYWDKINKYHELCKDEISYDNFIYLLSLLENADTKSSK